MSKDIVGREWYAEKYEGILVDQGCLYHFWFFKNQKELEEMRGANEQGWEVFGSMEDFEAHEDWVYEMVNR